MAILSEDSERARRARSRVCRPCSLCCTVLRVDELEKRAGSDCVHQRGELGCAIHASRPQVCRSYRCLWLQGGLEDEERPDRLGAVVDLEPMGGAVQLAIRMVDLETFDDSPALRRIALRYRSQMPVRVSDVRDILNPDRPFRVLLPDDLEHRIEGEWIDVFRAGAFVERRRMSWAERWARRASIWWRNLRLR